MDISSGVFIYLKLRGAIRMDNMGEISPHPNPKGFVLEGESLLNISKKASRGQCLPFTDLSEVNRKDQLLGQRSSHSCPARHRDPSGYHGNSCEKLKEE